MKKRIHEILEPAPEGNFLSKAADLFIMGLILLNGAAVVLESMKSMAKYDNLFEIFETFSVFIFTIEYGLRLWSCTIIEKYQYPIRGRLRFALTPMALVDLFAILPFYLYMIIPYDLRVFRLFRIVRLLRLFKLIRYSHSLRIMDDVLVAKKDELFITLFLGGLLLLISSTLMYFLEHNAQPKAFTSIPAAMWWAVATLTTVGYGDIYPITFIGKLLGAIIAILGIGMFALPAGILASGFASELEKLKSKKLETCPHCGKTLNPS